MLGAYLPERTWVVPGVVMVMGLAAVLADSIVLLFSPQCDACRQDLVVFGLGLPLAFAALLAARYSSAPMIARRALLLAGLVFTVNMYLNFLSARGAWADGDLLACGGGMGATETCAAAELERYRAGANMALSAMMAAVSLWGTFARPPRSTGTAARNATNGDERTGQQ